MKHAIFSFLVIASTVASCATQATKEYVDSKTSNVLGAANSYTTAVSNKFETSKQDTLVSGTNIKTINGESVLGAGDIEFSSGVDTNAVIALAASQVTNDVAAWAMKPHGAPSAITNRIADASGNEVWADGMWVEVKRGFGVGYWTMRYQNGNTVVCDKWFNGYRGYGWFDYYGDPISGVYQDGSILTQFPDFPSIPMDFGRHTVTNEDGVLLEVEYHDGLITNTIATTSITNGLAREVASNAANIATNAANIATNSANIATNAANIASNAANIATNAANIATRTTVADVDDLVSVKVYGDGVWKIWVTNLVGAVIDDFPAYFEEGQGWYFEPCMIYNGKQWTISGYITYLEGDGTENYLTTTQTFYDSDYQNQITADLVLRRNFSINRYGLATTNALASSIALAADYALTNHASAASFILRSGEIASASVASNATVTLDFSSAANRSGDAFAYIVAGAEGALTVNPDTYAYKSFDTDFLKIAAGTNLFGFSKLTPNVILINRKEVK